MTLPKPSWQVKTRPCPFYQQGSCFFADACNFLHTVSATVIPEALSPNQCLNHPDTTTPAATPTNLPCVVVDSPSPVPSPCRSPRTTGLLLALGFIDDPGDIEKGTGAADKTLTGEDTLMTRGDALTREDALAREDTLTGETACSEYLTTVVNEGFSLINEILQEESYYTEEDTDDYAGNWTALSDYNDLSPQSRSEIIGQDPQQGVEELTPLVYDGRSERDTVRIPVSSHQENEIQPSSVEVTPSEPVVPSPHVSVGLLSPIELSNLHLGPFRLDDHAIAEDVNSFGPGYEDTWQPPNPLLPSPPRSPSISSTFDLLSSPFGTHSSRLCSPYLTAFRARSPASPARTISSTMLEEVSYLDLGLGSPEKRTSPPSLDGVGNKSYFSPHSSLNDQDLVDSSLFSAEDSQIGPLEDDQSPDHNSYGHASIWDPEDGPTAVFVGPDENYVREQVTAAIKRQSRSSPLHFLQSRDTNFVDNDAFEHSSFLIDSDSSIDASDIEATSRPPPESTEEGFEDNQISLDNDTTAVLPYLRSPHLAENDTLQSLYDIYSDIAPSKDVISDSIRNAGLSPPRPVSPSLSNNSTPASSLRERVFTPPHSGKKRSGTITADSPPSLSSPITSINSFSAGRSSPFSVLDDIRHPSGGTGGRSFNDETSRKVPFGFRKSYTLGRPSNSLLMSSRNLTRSVPSSPYAQVPDAIPDLPISSISKGLKPLRMSTTLNTQSISQSKFQSRRSTISVNTHSFHQSGNNIRTSISSTTVSLHSSSSNPLPSSSHSSFIPPHVRNTLISSKDYASSPLSSNSFEIPAKVDEPCSAPASFCQHPRPPSRLSESHYDKFDESEDDTDYHCHDIYDETIRRPIPVAPHTAPVVGGSAVFHQSIVTPRPNLMFAIASDDVEQVRQVLSGNANPNDCVGPQSALAFTLTNDKLTKKLDIVKALLAYGADPTIATKTGPQNYSLAEGKVLELSTDPVQKPSVMDGVDLATRYYVERANAAHTQQSSTLIHRSFFRPLTRVRYELIGQDRVLEQLFRVLSMHSRGLTITPIVVMLCGPSGHGKSLLARKFGSLLDVATHTVNMTTLKSTHDLWQSYSISPYETPTTCTLAEFLINNEGKRCVVVLDEIEKTEEKTLWSLLMPWELGRCAFEASSRHIDVRNVIWLGTSNIGNDLVFQHLETQNPEQLMTREEYVNLMALLRPKVSAQLGAPVLSRITTVLPFVPFTLDEKKAICSEALYNFGGDILGSLPFEAVQKMIDTALGEYHAAEGARSLYRAISHQLADII